MRVYDDSVRRSAPSCRQELLDILDKSSISLPFEFSYKTFEGSSRTSPAFVREDVKGVFVPPAGLILVGTSDQLTIPYGTASVSGRVWMANLLTSLRWHHDEKYPGFVYGTASPASWLIWIFPVAFPQAIAASKLSRMLGMQVAQHQWRKMATTTGHIPMMCIWTQWGLERLALTGKCMSILKAVCR